MSGWLVAGLVVAAALVLLALHDLTQRSRAVLRAFPVIGHLRYLLIEIGPAIRQYLIADNKEELPFNRNERSWIERSAERKNNYFGFGTDEQVYGIGYPIIKHSAFPYGDWAFTGSRHDKTADLPCAKVIGRARKRATPFQPPSLVNISAMSYGALGRNAVSAINKGCTLAGCYQNTGEGGLAPYHRLGADLCFQIGTGYFGCRTTDGRFDLDRLAALCEEVPQIRMIEIKLSQGAKPGKGGTLPGVKVTEEIAAIRGVEPGVDCISPNTHTAFDDVDGLIGLVERIADRTGRPVGIKSAVGQLGFFAELAEKMSATGRGPDFITIDGAEGGTGAAPLTFADHVALPYKLAFTRVYKLFQAVDPSLVDDIVWIGSAKLGFPDRAIVAMAQGADLINVAREGMMAIGCIQAQKCHTGHCPTGVTTHNPWLQRGLDVETHAKRLQAYVETLRNEIHAVTHAAGYTHPGLFTPHDVELSAGPSAFRTLYDVIGYDKKQYAPGQRPRFKPIEERDDHVLSVVAARASAGGRDASG